ncbi:hypothetical protein [Undibacterium sp. Xuan67W]|uniref:hypothetical protein n=1 Tax=Undibacterium sp. Xuan67W TaxID=3413057 RepID=UPI003BF3642D
MNKWVYRIVLAVILIVILDYGISYFYIPTTESYKVAVTYVNADKSVLSRVGEIQTIRFIPFDYKYSNDSAREVYVLRLAVIGSRAEVNLLVQEIKHDDQQLGVTALHILGQKEGFPYMGFEFD